MSDSNVCILQKRYFHVLGTYIQRHSVIKAEILIVQRTSCFLSIFSHVRLLSPPALFSVTRSLNERQSSGTPECLGHFVATMTTLENYWNRTHTQLRSINLLGSIAVGSGMTSRCLSNPCSVEIRRRATSMPDAEAPDHSTSRLRWVPGETSDRGAARTRECSARAAAAWGTGRTDRGPGALAGPGRTATGPFLGASQGVVGDGGGAALISAGRAQSAAPAGARRESAAAAEGARDRRGRRGGLAPSRPPSGSPPDSAAPSPPTQPAVVQPPAPPAPPCPTTRAYH